MKQITNNSAEASTATGAAVEQVTATSTDTGVNLQSGQATVEAPADQSKPSGGASAVELLEAAEQSLAEREEGSAEVREALIHVRYALGMLRVEAQKQPAEQQG